MGIEQEITFQLDAATATVAMDTLLGRAPLRLDGAPLRPLGTARRVARMYLYLLDSEYASDRWVLGLTGERTRRVRKQRVSPTAKVETTERVRGDALDAGGELAAAFVKLKLIRQFEEAGGGRLKAACDWLIPVSLDWSLCGAQSFWHLELEGGGAATARARVRLGARRLGPRDLITRSKADYAVRRLGITRPYELPPRAWRTLRDSVSAQLWSYGWVPAPLVPLLDSAGLAARADFD